MTTPILVTPRYIYLDQGGNNMAQENDKVYPHMAEMFKVSSTTLKRER
jgi:hypothetical protein